MNGYLLFFWVFICPIVGAAIGRTRESQGMGAILGLLFGPLGWLLALLNDKRPQCPECQGRVSDGARKCQHCGSTLFEYVPIACPHCGLAGKVPSNDLAEKIECPGCKKSFNPALAPVSK